jgi:N-acetylneuraminic acid mutarotase
MRLWLGLAALSCSFVATPAANAQTPDATPEITNPADLHFLDVNEQFDPTANSGTGSWTEKAPMPTARAGIAICKVNDPTGFKPLIYAIGGRELNDCSTLQTVEAYDPATDTWTKGLAEPKAKRWRAAGGTLGGIIYLVGGESREGDPQACGDVVGTVEAYDPVLNTWSAKAPMKKARTQVSLAVDAMNNKLYAIGGSVGQTGNPPWAALPTVEVYDPTTDTWSPFGRYAHAAALPSVG